MSAAQLLTEIVEMGFSERPLILWVGPKTLTECLSPYGRDLRELLIHWAYENPQSLGADLQPLPETLSEDAVYCVLQDFLKTDIRLSEEQQKACRTVGIYHSARGGTPSELIDLSRVDPSGCDARLLPWPKLPTDAPVVIRVEPSIEASTLQILFEKLGRQLVAVVFALPATLLESTSGALVIPTLLINGVTGEKLSPLTSTTLTSEALGLPFTRGSVLCVPNADIVFHNYDADFFSKWHVRGYTLSDLGLLSEVRDAVWLRFLPNLRHLQWFLINTTSEISDRLTLAQTQTSSALAIKMLRQWLAEPSMPPKPSKTSQRKSAPPFSAGLRPPLMKRKMQIKV
jgi:hypothetical protein